MQLRRPFLIIISAVMVTSWQPDPNTCGRQGPVVPGGSVKLSGGHDAKNFAWPWMARLYVNDSDVCGASIFDSNWVITAAHCIQGPNEYRIRAGSVSISHETPFTQTRTAEQVIVHPKYMAVETGAMHFNDIALLKMSEPFNITEAHEINTICLPTKDMTDQIKVGQKAGVIGWGKINETDFPDILQEATVRIYSDSLCNESYGWTITENMICAGGFNPIEFCQGDGGGPLMASSGQNKDQYYLFGVLSFGPHQNVCGDVNYKPDVYMRVTQYEDWVRDTVYGLERHQMSILMTIIIYGSVAFVVLSVIIGLNIIARKKSGRHGGPGGGYGTLPRHRTNATVAVCTLADKNNVNGLIRGLSEILGRNATVKYIQLQEGNLNDFRTATAGENFDFLILCHTVKHQRGLAITNVDDALFNRFLQNAATSLGRQNIGVIIHDFSLDGTDTEDKYDNKMDAFRTRQPDTFKNSAVVLFAWNLGQYPPQLPPKQLEEIYRLLTQL